MREKRIGKKGRTQQQLMQPIYTNNNETAINPSKMRNHENFTSRMFVRLFTWAYKKARQKGNE